MLSMRSSLLTLASPSARSFLIAALLATASAASADDGASIDPGAWLAHPTEPFEIAAGEVTVAQFRACVAAGTCSESTVNPSCNFGRDDRDAHPVNCVSYDGAEQYCAWAGGRICTEAEWLAACKGASDSAYPYGATFDPEACNVHSNAVQADRPPSDTQPVASMSSCEGGLGGLYDMAGNVGEWIDGCKGNYCKFRGAGYLSNDPVEHFTACGGVCSGNQKTLMSNVVGIRCCRDKSD